MPAIRIHETDNKLRDMIWLGLFAIAFLVLSATFMFGWIPFTTHSGWLGLIVGGSTLLVLWGYVAEIAIAMTLLFLMSTLTSLIIPIMLIAFFVVVTFAIELPLLIWDHIGKSNKDHK